MDERFRSKGRWVAVAAVAAIIFLCVTLCFLGVLGTMFMRHSAAAVPHVQAPAGGEGAAVPQVFVGPAGGHTGLGLLGLLGFGALLFFGLLLLLGVGRFVLGSRRCGPHATGGRWKGHPHPWGPRGWHGKMWQEGEEPDAPQEPPDDSDTAYEGAA